MLCDRTERERLGTQAREHARRYTPERMAGAMADIYECLVEPQLMAGAA
jgi:hypothetical protein